MPIFLCILACILALVTYYYNKLVSLKNIVAEGWSGIDVQLKRRHDLIPNLVEIVKGYAGHEKETFEEVVRLRGESRQTNDPADKSLLENNISTDLKKIFALVEAYPNLKADANFRKLQDTLVEVEDSLQFSRRYYNGAVRAFNTLVQSFPSNLIARLFAYQPMKFFELEYATERKTPDISF
jgi:LemA protein